MKQKIRVYSLESLVEVTKGPDELHTKLKEEDKRTQVKTMSDSELKVLIGKSDKGWNFLEEGSEDEMQKSANTARFIINQKITLVEVVSESEAAIRCKK